MKNKIISIDVGGTKIKWSLFDSEYNQIENGVIETEAFTVKADGVIEKIGKICNELEKKYYEEIACVGMSMPGAIDSKNKMSLIPLNHIPGFNKLDIQEEFAKYSDLPISVLNDANASALGEYHFGSLKEKENSILITLGTGIGAGIIINGNIYLGKNFYAGEIGQQLINGSKWESVASARWITIAGNMINGTIDLSCEEILELSKSNTDIHKEYIKWMSNISIGIVNIIQILSPERISISGGIIENEAFDIKLLNEMILEKIPFNFDNPTDIVKAKLGNKSALLGAMRFSKKEFMDKK